MYSSYQHHPTSYGNLSLRSAHEINSDLHRQAEAIAPRFADETADAGCTNARPGADSPRRQKAWDLIAEALAWNLIADDSEAVIAAKLAELAGKPYQVGFAWNVTPGERVSYQQPFVIDLNGGNLLTYAQVNEIEKTVAKGQAVIVLDAQVVEGNVVEFFDTATDSAGGLVENLPPVRRIARVSHFRSDGTVCLYDPEGVRAIRHPEALTVIAERAEVGWGNLATTVEPDPGYRCPECDSYSGTFTPQPDMQVLHSTCGRVGFVNSFIRGTQEYEDAYEGNEDEDEPSLPEPVQEPIRGNVAIRTPGKAYDDQGRHTGPGEWLRLIHEANRVCKDHGLEPLFDSPESSGDWWAGGYVEEYPDARVLHRDDESVSVVSKTPLGAQVLALAAEALEIHWSRP